MRGQNKDNKLGGVHICVEIFVLADLREGSKCFRGSPNLAVKDDPDDVEDDSNDHHCHYSTGKYQCSNELI